MGPLLVAPSSNLAQQLALVQKHVTIISMFLQNYCLKILYDRESILEGFSPSFGLC